MSHGYLVHAELPVGVKAMRVETTTKEYKRKQLICDCIDGFQRNNKLQWKAFLKLQQQRKLNLRDKHGRMIVDGKVDDEIRVKFSIPDTLLFAVNTILEAHKQVPLFEKEEENRWLARTYPIFLLTEKY